MSNRYVSLAVCLSMAALAAFGDATSGARYVVEFPQPNSSGTRFQGFPADANSQNPVIDGNGPTNASLMVPKPDGSKFYIMGSSGIQSVDPAFSSTSFHSINGITGTPNTMAISPDGKYLYVGTCASGCTSGNLFILDTSTDSVIPNGLPNSIGGVIGIVFSADSQYAFILTDSVFGSAVRQMKTSTQQVVGQALNLPFGGANSIEMSPLQLIYVTDGYYIYEIDPTTLSLTANGTITTNVSTLGPLRFTPDGSTAYAVNLTPSIGGRAIVQINLATHAFNELNYFSLSAPPKFVDVFPASATRVFAVTSSDPNQANPNTIYDVTPQPFAADVSASLGSLQGGVVNNVLSAALSNEQPAARYLYLLVANGQQTNLDKIDLTTNGVVLQSLAILGPGVLQFAYVPPQSGAASFIQLNNNQVLTGGATSAPLSVVLLNSNGWPLYNVPVTYTLGDPTSGIVINGTNPVSTNKDGRASVTATMPSAPGIYTVTATAGSATSAYTLTVPGGGIGPTGGPSQVSIVSGDGQLLYTSQPCFGSIDTSCELTIKVVDTNGKPLSGVPVTFSIVSGPGSIDFPNTQTDTNGLAFTDFQPVSQLFGPTFVATDVNASTSLGSVDFFETTYQLNSDGTGQPQISMAIPTDLSPITVGEGDVLTNAIVMEVFTGTSPVTPIPNIGMRLADPTNIFNNSTVASCQNNPLSDTGGMVHCNLVVSCQAGITSVGIQPIVGELRQVPPTGLTLNIVKGSSRTIGILSGNNQTGNAGQTLGQALVATVTDNCGVPVSGVPVTWKVTQGSASLVNTVSTSDLGGHVSTKLALGQIPGTVNVTASLGASSQVNFTATNNVSVGSLTLVSGSGQTAIVSQGFAQPLIFVVKDTNGNPVPGIQVNFSVASGSASLGASSAVTTSAGQASVTVTAGATPGPVTIQASYSTFTAAASLTVQAKGAVLTPSSFTSSASGKTGIVACGIATATGAGLASSVSGTVLGNPLNPLGGPLPYTLAALSISVNGIPAPIYWISNSNGVQQVTFQTPCETVAGSATVTVITNGGTASSATTTITGVQAFAAQPGIFTYAGPSSTLYGTVIRPDGSYVSPSNFAHRGETNYLVATGLGVTTPAAITGSTGTGQTIPLSQILVGINNAGVPVVSAQYVSGAIGVYYIGFQIPDSAPTGPNQVLALGEIVGGQTIFDGQGALLPGVQ